MHFNNFIQFLETRLHQPLPGTVAQAKMMPEVKGLKYHPLKAPPDHAKPSAILCLLTPSISGTIEIMLTLRSDSLTTHKGQISFPGGRSEKGELPHETALRETFEEVGLSPDDISVLGSLTQLYVPPSNSLIYPIIGFSANRPSNLTLQTNEVQEVFYTEIPFFLDHQNVKIGEWDRGGTTVLAPYWDIHPLSKLWGATAMILSEVCALYEEYEMGRE
ncbi:MAG: CoA pyrophosphatase [Ignavibacteria bacterium]|nr:CoA pyrophosphatase [Ignavibacteria bacterium]